MQEKEQEDELDKVKDKDQEYGYDQADFCCMFINFTYMSFDCFLLT